jgi:hypothetical protein
MLKGIGFNFFSVDDDIYSYNIIIFSRGSKNSGEILYCRFEISNGSSRHDDAAQTN